MSFLSFLNNKKEEVSLIIDIGNGSITSSLVLFTKGLKPEFLYVNSATFLIRDEPNVSKLVTDMKSVLEDLLNVLMKKGFTHRYWNTNSKNISKALVSFSSPWFVSKTKHINLRQDTPFVITKSFLDDVLKKEGLIFKKELSRTGN